MNKQHTDLTFFTNDQNQTLLDRFKVTLSDTRLFDVLVGYFRSSGFYQLYDSIEPVAKTRILVGLGIDDESNRAINAYRNQSVLDFESHKNSKIQFQENLIEEIEHSEEADDKLELGLKKFIEFLQSECADSAEDRGRGGNGRKLEIRAFPSQNIHAKVYIGRFAPDDRDYGFVITGSSNFSYSGLVANREFNVELRQRRDVEFALAQFEELWQQSVDISDDFVDAVQKKTWLNDAITPYELYLKLIYEYLQEDINLQDNIEIFLPEGFMAPQYQQQAVRNASPAALIDKLYGIGVSAARSGDAVRARRALVELIAALDLERGGEMAATLRELYTFALRSVNAGDLAIVAELLGGLREAWRAGPLAADRAPALAA